MMYGKNRSIRMPCAKLLARNFPSGEDSSAVRHIEHRPHPEDSRARIAKTIKIAGKSFRISTHLYHMACGAHGFRERERKEDDCQYKRREGDQDQVDSLVAK